MEPKFSNTNPPDALPTDSGVWNTEANNTLDSRHRDESVHKFNMKAYRETAKKPFDSRSKITYPQFLLLRALWDSKRQKKFEMHHWLPQDVIQTAKQLLKRHDDWWRYIKELERSDGNPPNKDKDNDRPDVGKFCLVLDEQRDIRFRNSEYNEKREVPKYAYTPTKGLDHNEHPKLLIQRTKSYSYDQTPSKAGANLKNIDFLSSKYTSEDQRGSYKVESSPAVTGRQLWEPTTESARAVQLPWTPIGQLMPSATAENISNTGQTTLPEYLSPLLRADAEAVNNEAAVNAVAVALFNAILYPFPEFIKSKWYLWQEVFHFGKLFEARTDGVLRIRNNDKSLCLLEVKACTRNAQESRIQMQESAQMTSWIYSDDKCSGEIFLSGADMEEMGISGTTRRRLLISQDHAEIYLTFAEYDDQYIKYLMNDGEFDKHNPFLVMNQFGPFRVNNASHMRTLGTFIVALSLHQEHARDSQTDPFQGSSAENFTKQAIEQPLKTTTFSLADRTRALSQRPKNKSAKTSSSFPLATLEGHEKGKEPVFGHLKVPPEGEINENDDDYDDDDDSDDDYVPPRLF